MTRLCHQQWSSEDMLPQIKNIPILFLSGLKDEIIPYVWPVNSSSHDVKKLTIRYSSSHMAELYNLCQAKTKIWRTFPNGSHNDTVAEPGYFEYIHSFVVDEVLD